MAFLAWTQLDDRRGGLARSPSSLAALALVAGLAAALLQGREGWAFVGHLRRHRARSRGAVPGPVPRRDADLAGRRGTSLTTTNAAATAYTLKVMTVVAVIFTPVVLAYQGWTYWVFRKRIAVHHIPAVGRPADAAPSAAR